MAVAITINLVAIAALQVQWVLSARICRHFGIPLRPMYTIRHRLGKPLTLSLILTPLPRPHKKHGRPFQNGRVI